MERSFSFQSHCWGSVVRSIEAKVKSPNHTKKAGKGDRKHLLASTSSGSCEAEKGLDELFSFYRI